MTLLELSTVYAQGADQIHHRILELRLEGKKRMDAEAFLRGYQIPEGTVLSGKRQE